MLYTSLVSCEILLFAYGNWIFSADHRSINMSLASLLQMQILPRFFDAILLLAKRRRFWRLKDSFSTPESSHSWSVMIAKTLGMRIPVVLAREPLFKRAETTSRGGLGPPNFFGTRAENFAFTQQKSSGPCPVLLVRAPKFWSALPKINVV